MGSCTAPRTENPLAPLEKSVRAKSAWSTVLRWQGFALFDLFFIASVSQSFATGGIYAGALAALLGLTWFITTRPPRGDIAAEPGERLRRPGFFAPAYHRLVHIPLPFFDRWYLRSLTPEERLAFGALFPAERWSPSSYFFCSSLLAVLAFTIVFTVGKNSAPALLSVYPLCVAAGIGVTWIGGLRPPLLSRTPFPYLVAASAYAKLAWRRWLLALITLVPAAAFVSLEPFGCYLVANTFSVVLFAPTFALLSACFRLAQPVRSVGHWPKRAFHFCALFTLPAIAMSLSLKAMEHDKTLLGLAEAAGISYATAFLVFVLHYTGWKRGWYDI